MRQSQLCGPNWSSGHFGRLLEFQLLKIDQERRVSSSLILIQGATCKLLGLGKLLGVSRRGSGLLGQQRFLPNPRFRLQYWLVQLLGSRRVVSLLALNFRRLLIRLQSDRGLLLLCRLNVEVVYNCCRAVTRKKSTKSVLLLLTLGLQIQSN